MNTAALTAAHRFGLGEADLQTVGGDARGWLLAQIGPADAQRGTALPSAAEGLRLHAEFQRLRRQRRLPPDPVAAASAPASTESLFVDPFRPIVLGDLRARLSTAAATQRPFAERLALFWSNHFTVSMAKANVRGLVGAFEREAIRPHVAASFGTMLNAAVRHAAMLRYLDNDLSAGPQSRVVRVLAARAARRGDDTPHITGLNENLAREVLELHTLGVSGGYTQADVTEFAKVLTGWRVPLRAVMDGSTTAVAFDPGWHEPGPKTVLGRRYDEGPQALGAVLHDLAVHPSTARFIATKLARHLVADDPPPALVARLDMTFRHSGGDLAALARTLVESPEAWSGTRAKLRTPEEFVVASVRLLGLGDEAFVRQPDGGTGLLGQRVQAAPSPAGWPDRAEDWLGPDAVWKRVEWATRVAARSGRRADARLLAQASLGPGLGEGTAGGLSRAADGPQALALLLLSPEFQRR